MFWALVLSVSAQSGEVTVYMNDTALAYTGRGFSGDSWGDPAYYKPNCGGYRYMQYIDDSVSLIFTGTSMTAYFLADSSYGATAHIMVDGGSASQDVNTMISGNTAGECVPLSATFPGLAPTTHNVTVLLSAQTTSPGYIDMSHFVYAPVATSTTPSLTASVGVASSSPASTGSVVTGLASPRSGPEKSNAPIIGGVVDGIAVLMIGGVLGSPSLHPVEEPWLRREPYSPNATEYKETAVTPTFSLSTIPNASVVPTIAARPAHRMSNSNSGQGQTFNNSPTEASAVLDRALLENLINHDVPTQAIARVIEMMAGGEGASASALGREPTRPPRPRYDANDHPLA
ncbi:hypothetical protein FRB96_002403 [Tulasnella sp. 330]|nr:hypothetical protein FRB96_002403 [Tulasnella sp. 330]